jgi:uncharacterized protein YqeY
MSLEATLNEDLKAAQIAKDERTVSTLRMVKSTLLNLKVSNGSRDSELSDEAIIGVLQKEAKKRQESADLFAQGGNQTKADDELAEKQIIEKYLPEQMSEADIAAIADEIIATLDEKNMSKIGQVIGQVKQKTGAAADGSAIARVVKERLSN